MLRWLSRQLKRPDTTFVAQTIPRDQHPISRQHISSAALKVMYQLIEHGYQAHMVGGSVRDLLLGRQPKDFDIATDATPEQVRQVFRHAHIIGQRFRIVHVRFGHEIIEVTTFRGGHQNAKAADDVEQRADGLLLRDNIYGSIEEDARRRDFTVNALYYTVADFCVRDFCNGMVDVQEHLIRTIGDPETRYKEDPVRMLRAIRLATKLGFQLETKTAAPIHSMANKLSSIPAARLFEEVLKLFLAGHAAETYAMLQTYGLFAQLFPDTARALQDNPGYDKFVRQALINTDERIRQEKPVTPAFLYAALLWPAMQVRAAQLERDGLGPYPAMNQAMQEIVARQQRHTVLPRRFSTPMMEIWQMQFHLPRRQGARAAKLAAQARFRAAYDFLLLREQSGEQLDGLGEWWTLYQAVDADEQHRMASSLNGGEKRKRRPRRRKPAGSPAQTPQ